MLLISMPVQDAFVALVNLINNSFLKYHYDQKQDYVGQGPRTTAASNIASD
jgi:hypothetical protein